mmetsp:Transcript_45387/g.91055  ORF Transcript_45387/g.91055 Transcript_45387/m.91055 type:complete len:259 (-) Transcript_45387:215-991(-)
MCCHGLVTVSSWLSKHRNHPSVHACGSHVQTSLCGGALSPSNAQASRPLAILLDWGTSRNLHAHIAGAGRMIAPDVLLQALAVLLHAKVQPLLPPVRVSEQQLHRDVTPPCSWDRFSLDTCLRGCGHAHHGRPLHAAVTLQHLQSRHRPQHTCRMSCAPPHGTRGSRCMRPQTRGFGWQNNPLVPFLGPTLKVHQHPAAARGDGNELLQIVARWCRCALSSSPACAETNDLPHVELSDVIHHFNALGSPPAMLDELLP